VVPHACNPSYAGDISRRSVVGGQPWAKSARPYLKITKVKKKDLGVWLK
jgi:hypothetical protein